MDKSKSKSKKRPSKMKDRISKIGVHPTPKSRVSMGHMINLLKTHPDRAKLGGIFTVTELVSRLHLKDATSKLRVETKGVETRAILNQIAIDAENFELAQMVSIHVNTGLLNLGDPIIQLALSGTQDAPEVPDVFNVLHKTLEGVVKDAGIKMEEYPQKRKVPVKPPTSSVKETVKIHKTRSSKANLSQLMDLLHIKTKLGNITTFASFSGVVRGYARDGKILTRIDIDVEEQTLTSLQRIVEETKQLNFVEEAAIHFNAGKLTITDSLAQIVLGGNQPLTQVPELFNSIVNVLERIKREAKIKLKEYTKKTSYYTVPEDKTKTFD